MSKPILYHMNLSPPSRFVVVTANLIGLDIEIRPVDLFKREQDTEAYKSINPTATVPALVDGDVNIFDSSAIAIYLVEKYGKNDSLYPKNLGERTKVNEILFYVSSFFFPRMFDIFVPGFRGLELEIPKEKSSIILRGYSTVETFLKGNEFLSGDMMRLCDLSFWCMVESLSPLVPINEKDYPNLTSWLEKMRKLPIFEFNKAGAEEHVRIYRECIERARNAQK